MRDILITLVFLLFVWNFDEKVSICVNYETNLMNLTSLPIKLIHVLFYFYVWLNFKFSHALEPKMLIIHIIVLNITLLPNRLLPHVYSNTFTFCTHKKEEYFRSVV